MSAAIHSLEIPLPPAPLFSVVGTPEDESRIVPFEESADWDRLTPPARKDVLTWLVHMEAVASAGVGGGKRQMVIERVARTMGVSAVTARRKFDKWKAEGWRGLVNQARFPCHLSLPGPFIEFWKATVESFQRDRTMKRAWRAVLKRLEKWEKGDVEMALPGYAHPPKRMMATGLPEGWSYKNFSQHKPDVYQLALRHQGPKAASAFLPSIRASREDLRVGQLYFFDDEETDMQVNSLGINKVATRPMAFHCMDFKSAKNVTRGYQPTVKDLETGKKKQLDEKTFSWFIVHVLTNVGYRPTGTHFVVEHGTASITRDFEERITHATKGAVVVDRSGRFGDAAFKGLIYNGARTGNFRFKGPLESFFSIMRTEFAALPGQTGIHRNHTPEENAGLMSANKFWLKQLESMPQERQLMMRLPVMHWGAFVKIANELIEGLNQRTDHALGQWESSGHVVSEFTVDGMNWFGPDKFALMTDVQRAAVEALVTLPGHNRVRKMSPNEVWDADSKDLVRLPKRSWVSLMDEKYAIEKKVTDRLEFKFEDALISPEPLFYVASVKNERGHRINLKRGETYLIYLNPLDTSCIQVCEAAGSRRGAWIGEATQFVTQSRTDVEALMRNYGEVQAITAPDRADVERRAMGEIHRRTSDKHWNERLKNPAPLTPREHAAADADREAADLADMAMNGALEQPRSSGPEADIWGESE